MHIKHNQLIASSNKSRVFLCSVLFSCLLSPYAKAQEITAIDFNGDLIGKVIPDGSVIGFNNDYIGNITVDSLVLNPEGELIGGVVPQGIAIGNDTKVLGKVSSDGSVRLASGKIIGKALPNGLVVDDYYKIIGSVLFPGLVYGSNGQTVGRLAGNGIYTNLRGNEIGYVAPTGYAYRRQQDDYVLEGRLISSKMVISTSGDFIGSVVPGGEVSGFNAETLGRLRANGFVYDKDNKIIGGIVQTGYAFSDAGEYLGYVSYNGEVISKGQSIGRQRANGEIVNAKGEHLGYFVDLAATATDTAGRYLGRLMPGGDIVKGKESIGRLGPRNSVVNKSGNIIGWLITPGSVFDYAGRLRGMALNSGDFVSLGGNINGVIKHNQAYDNAGKVIGAVLLPTLAVDINNVSLGIPNITGYTIDGQQLVTPYGYVLTQNGDVSGFSIPMQPLYSLFGISVGRMEIDGSIRGSSGTKLNGRFTPAGILLDERNRMLGKMISAHSAVDNQSQNIGNLSDGNLVLNAENKIEGKILPDYSIVKTSSVDSAVLMPDSGRAYSERIAVSIDGNLIGNLNYDGSISDNSGAKVGKVSSRSLTMDNNNTLNGAVVPYVPAVTNDKNCKYLGMVSPEGVVRNWREINMGRILANHQLVSDTGLISGHLVRPDSVIDYNGNIIGVVSANGQVGNYNNDFLGCPDSFGRLYKENGELIGQIVAYEPVMDFNSKIIGRSIADGTVVDEGGRVIGYMQPNDNVNSKVGQPLGELFRYKVAFDNKGNYIGRVQTDGKVLNDLSQEIGRVDQGGYVLSKDKTIGFALYDFYVYNAFGQAIGYLTKTGEVLNFNNKNLGRIRKGFLVDKDEQVIGRGARSYNIRDNSNNVIGILSFDGKLINSKNQELGTLNENGEILSEDKKVIARAHALQYYNKPKLEVVVDDKGNIVGYLDEDGNIVNKNGDIIGYKSTEGELLTNDGKKIGRVANLQKIFDTDGKLIGYVKADGSAVNEDGKVIGKLNEDGTVTDASNNLIGGIGIDWYERVKPKKDAPSPTEVPNIGDPVEDKDQSTSTASGKQYRRSLNIALTPDGEYLGEIQEDGKVINKEGQEVGTKMPDGLIINKNGDLVGVADIKKSDGNDIFVPAGTFGKGGAYGTGTGPSGDLGPGGGYGPGERYSPQRQHALNIAMAERRQNITVGKISSNSRREAFDGMQEDWSEQGIQKVISSWRVDMSEMILADKPIPAVIARSIDSTHPTPVTAFVERNVYAEEGRNILIPAGSRVIGSLGGVTTTSEKTSTSAKIEINWERLIRPDGSIFVFDGITGDAQGRGGALGYLDQQLFKRYALPVMTTALTSLTSYYIDTDQNSDGETETSQQQAASDARQNFLSQMNNIFEQILSDKASIRPMTYIPAGTRIIIYPNVDLWLRSIERDKEASSYEQVGGGKGLLDGDEGKRGKRETRTGVNSTGDTTQSGGQVIYDENGNGIEAQNSNNVLIGDSSQKKQRVVPPPPVYTGQPPATAMSGSGATRPSYNQPNTERKQSSSSSSSNNNDVPQLF